MTSEFAIAVHALVYLNHKGETVSSEALAENICTNPARVRKVMAKLKKAGLVATRRGSTGDTISSRLPRRSPSAASTRRSTSGWYPPAGSRATGRRPAWWPPAWGTSWTTSIPTSTSSAAAG